MLKSSEDGEVQDAERRKLMGAVFSRKTNELTAEGKGFLKLFSSVLFLYCC